MALNAWHGRRKPMAPAEHAGMLQLQINFRTPDLLEKAIENIPIQQKVDRGYLVKDPIGNLLYLTVQ